MAHSSNTAAFGALFVALFGLTFGFLVLVDAVPEPTPRTGPIAQQQVPTNTAAPQEQPELPVRIAAAAVSLDETVSNPESSDLDVLDQALLKGGVRHPTSAPLGVEGTVLIYGHSSYLPVVRNQAFKAFNGIQKLEPGETISVYSGTSEYRYSVVGVREATTDDQSNLLDQGAGKHLVLVTCDSFRSKKNRFIVTADFVGKYSL